MKKKKRSRVSTGLTTKQILQQKKQQPYQNCDLEIIPESRTPTHTRSTVSRPWCARWKCLSHRGRRAVALSLSVVASGRAERSERVAVPLAKKKGGQSSPSASSSGKQHHSKRTRTQKHGVCVCARARCRHRSVRSVRPDTVGQPKGREKRVCGPAAHGDSTHTHLSRHVSCARELFLFFQHPAHQQQPLFDHHFHW